MSMHHNNEIENKKNLLQSLSPARRGAPPNTFESCDLVCWFLASASHCAETSSHEPLGRLHSVLVFATFI